MQSTVTYTIDQFKKNMMDDFKAKLTNAGNVAMASKVNNETFTCKFYIKGNPEPQELEKFTVEINID